MNENSSPVSALHRIVSILDGAVLGTAAETLRAQSYVVEETALVLLIDPIEEISERLYRIPEGHAAECLIQFAEREGARYAAEAECVHLDEGGSAATPGEQAEDLRAYTAIALKEALSEYLLAPIPARRPHLLP